MKYLANVKLYEFNNKKVGEQLLDTGFFMEGSIPVYNILCDVLKTANQFIDNKLFIIYIFVEGISTFGDYYEVKVNKNDIDVNVHYIYRNNIGG